MNPHTFLASWSRAHLVFFALVAVVLLPAVFGGGFDSLGRGLLFVLSALFLVFQHTHFPKEKQVRNFFYLCLVFLGLVLCSAFISFDYHKTVNDFFVLAVAMLVGFKSFALFNQGEFEDKFFKWLLLGTVLFALYGLYIFVGANPFFRLGSVFYQQNAFAGFMLPSLFFVFGYLFKTGSRWQLFIFGIIGIFLSAVFMLTFARGASLAFLGGFLVAAILLRWSLREWIKNVGITSLILLLGGVLAFFVFSAKNQPVVQTGGAVPSSPAQFFEYETPQENGLMARFVFLKETQRIFFLYPLTGVGWGTFGDAFFAHREGLRNYTTDPHNLIARSFVELGLVGGVVFLVLIGSIFYFVWQVAKKDRNDVIKRKSSFVVIGSFLALFFQNMVNADWLFPSDVVLFWVVVALLVGRVSEREGIAIPSVRWFDGLIIFVAIGLAVVGGTQVLARSYFDQAQELVSLGRSGEALDRYRWATHIDPWEPLYKRDLAIMYIQLTKGAGDKNLAIFYEKQALDEITRGLAIRPFDPYFFFLRGQIYAHQGDTKKAETAFQTALRHDRFTLFDAYRELVNLYFQQKDYQAVADLLQPIVRVYSEEVFASVAWINPHKDESRKDVADLWVRLGLAHLGLKDSATAGAAFETAQRFDPESIQAKRAKNCLASRPYSLDSFRNCFYSLER